MDEQKINRLIDLAERLLLHVEHGIPPEAVAVEDLRRLIREMKAERRLG